MPWLVSLNITLVKTIKNIDIPKAYTSTPIRLTSDEGENTEKMNPIANSTFKNRIEEKRTVECPYSLILAMLALLFLFRAT